MSNEAESLRSAIGDTSAQVKALASGTQALDTFTSSLQEVAGGVADAQGAISELDKEITVKVKAEDDTQKATQSAKASLAELDKDVNVNIKAEDDTQKATQSAKASLAELDKDVNVNIKAEDDTQKATQSAKARLRDLQKQMLDLEAAGQKNTDQFRRMAAEAGSLKDAIGDTSAQVKALASDTRALDTFTSAIQGIAGGFAVAQGAAALFGEESEDVQKAMMKVQAALALVNGATAVANALNKDSALMVNLNAAAQRAYALAVGTSTGAMKAFRLALVATGIGAAVVAIGLLIANFDKLTAAVKGFLGIKVKENIDEQIQSMERAAEIAKERGATEAEVFAMEFDISRKRLQNAKNEEEMAEARHQHNVLRAQYESYLKKAELEKQDAAAKEADKRQQEREKAAQERRRKQEQQREAAAAKQKQEREAAAAKQKEIDGIIADSRQVLLENSLSANERELEQIDASYEERLAKVQGNEEATNLLLAQLRAERTAKIKEQQDAADQAELDAQRAQLDHQIQIEDELYAEREKLRQEDLQRDKAYNEARVQFYNTASSSIVEIMRSLGGKSKALMLAALALEKGMAIAQVVINLQKELAGINANAALNPANALTAGAAGVTQALSLSTMAKINAGLRIAAIAATSIGQVSSITGGGGGGGGGTAGTGGGGGSLAPPTTGGFASGGGVMNPNSQLTNPNEGAGAGQGQGMRAYVVESDVRTVSGRLRRISEFAQLAN
jgi:hypothetical protein